ncbi:glycosyltransferase family 39 protein [Paenibacillus bovis]|uniref:4-amino-4-deoxy-L-arabinose transferase n=1 Tax=Paenibacillus bovis TaxID=1616788 RepID=A0A172ZH14_9BACL|nr:glycosyltransferase family 39 protein [Paenibacillus bovis]ANF96924.1 4-amino-4-deoxy-L-arabinose transferase [Paenibacillus bovis]
MQSKTTILSRSRIDIPLILILILSAFLNIWNIWDNGSANSYYTAAVTSMLQSFHNFFYASFDPAGYVTVDKPPVAFWIQTLFASVLGVHGWSVTLPAALAGVGSVGLVYLIVKPTFGLMAARLAALMMAVTPVAVAVQRSNNVDGLLVFTLLLAVWMLLKGIRNQKIGWILGGFAMIGVAFNEKMLQAYMILPAVYIFYVLAYKVNWKKKLSVLAIGTVILAAVSVSWAVVVDSVPAEDRPYVGSSQTNSVLELAFGYNGVSRLTGEMQNQGGPGGTTAKSGDSTADSGTASSEAGAGTGTQMNPGGMPGGGNMQPPGGNDNNRMRGGMFNTGDPGPLRLFQSSLSGQASLLLPFAIISLIALFAGLRRNTWHKQQYLETVFWLMWLLPVAGFFSIAGFFHQYYLIMLAPPVAILAAAGFAAQWKLYREGTGWQAWLLPVNVAVTTAFQLFVIYPYNEQIGSAWFYIVAIAGGLLTAGLLVGVKGTLLHGGKIYVASAAMTLLLLTPLYWASFPFMNPSSNISLPYGGPITSMGFGGGGDHNRMPGGTGDGNTSGSTEQTADSADVDKAANPPAAGTQRGGGPGGGMGENVNEKLLQYVTEHNTGEEYLFATSNANSASAYIIKTGKAVMAMGGYSGSDPIMTVDRLKEMISSGQVKYFLVNGFGGRGGSSEVTEWIEQHGTEVPAEDWQNTSTTAVSASMNPISASDGEKSSGSDSNINGMNRTSAGMGGFGGMMSSGTLYEVTPEDVGS